MPGVVFFNSESELWVLLDYGNVMLQDWQARVLSSCCSGVVQRDSARILAAQLDVSTAELLLFTLQDSVCTIVSCERCYADEGTILPWVHGYLFVLIS